MSAAVVFAASVEAASTQPVTGTVAAANAGVASAKVVPPGKRVPARVYRFTNVRANAAL